jgi:raffinose/stachyose/melibiose transport system permease protein
VRGELHGRVRLYMMALAPMLLVYLFAQRWVISGVMRGSVK